MDNKNIKSIIEAALFAAGRPVDMNELLRLFEESDRPNRKVIREALDELRADYEERAFEINEVASGFRVQVKQDFGEWVGRMSDRRPPRYSRALMETLALIAYRQPVTRGEIENVRGVTVSSNIVRTLLERGWVRIVGHRDVPGRPAMLGTTKEFLDYFGLKSLDELPSLAELKDIDSINVELDFGDHEAPAVEAGDGEATEQTGGESAGEEKIVAEASADDEQPVARDEQSSDESAEEDREDDELEPGPDVVAAVPGGG